MLSAPSAMPANEYGSLTFQGFTEPYENGDVVTDAVFDTAMAQQRYNFLVELKAADTAFAENEESVTLVMPELMVNGVSSEPYLSEDNSSARRITVTKGQTVPLYYSITMPEENLELSFHGNTITKQTKEAYDLTLPDLDTWQKYKAITINGVSRSVSGSQYGFTTENVEEGSAVVLTLEVAGTESGPDSWNVFNFLVEDAPADRQQGDVSQVVDDMNYWWNITYSFTMPGKDITLQQQSIETASLMMFMVPAAEAADPAEEPTEPSESADAPTEPAPDPSAPEAPAEPSSDLARPEGDSTEASVDPSEPEGGAADPEKQTSEPTDPTESTPNNEILQEETS